MSRLKPSKSPVNFIDHSSQVGPQANVNVLQSKTGSNEHRGHIHPEVPPQVVDTSLDRAHY
jgi:hypothetical protein